MNIALNNSSLTLAKALISTVISFIALMIILGFVYPIATTYIADIINKDKAHGSLIKNEQGVIVGSSLIGQDFSHNQKFFQSRPSASNYDACASGGYNLGPSSDKLTSLLKERTKQVKKQYQISTNIPTDMLTASGSGLDCHISYKNAMLQAPFIAKKNNLDLQKIYELIARHTDKQWFLSYDIVNVTTLNHELAKLQEQQSER